MTDTKTDELDVSPLFTEKEERLARAMVGVDPGWREAALNDPNFQKQLFYMVRVVRRLFDESSTRTADNIEVMDLTVRAYNVLKREGVHTVGELVALSRHDLLDMRNMGLTALQNIEEELALLGLKLKGAPS